MTATYRYWEKESEWTLSCMMGPAMLPRRPACGQLDERPQWLTDICTLALVGGHDCKPEHSPPDRFFWFRLNDAGELDSFVDITQPLPP